MSTGDTYILRLSGFVLGLCQPVPVIQVCGFRSRIECRPDMNDTTSRGDRKEYVVDILVLLTLSLPSTARTHDDTEYETLFAMSVESRCQDEWNTTDYRRSNRIGACNDDTCNTPPAGTKYTVKPMQTAMFITIRA